MAAMGKGPYKGGWDASGYGWGGWGGKGIIKGANWGKGFGKPTNPLNPYAHLGIDSSEPQDLMATSSAFWDSCIKVDDDWELEVNWAKVKLARQQIQKASGITVDTGREVVVAAASGTPGKMHERMAAEAGPESAEQFQERKQKLVQRIVDILKMSPTVTVEATQILNDTQVRQLRLGVFQMFIKYLTHQWPDLFEVQRIDGKTQFNVVLRDPELTTVDMSLERGTGGKKGRPSNHW